MDDWPTTRKYPRTLHEAFPHAREHSYPVRAYKPPCAWLVRWCGPILAVTIGAALASALIVWWSNPYA
jgi:hypothetical protein